MSVTISYSHDDKAWTSRHSYFPEWMVSIDGLFFTFKNGNLYQHFTNELRNNYYGVQYDSSITTVFNTEPAVPKVFKTVSLRGSNAWDLTAETNLEDGLISSDFFEYKEGNWYSHIRRYENDDNLQKLNVQGIGAMDAYDPTVGIRELTFEFTVNPSISSGDRIYLVDNGALLLIGTVSSHGADFIRITAAATNTPSPGDVIVFVKNSMAESFGLRGDYMRVELTNTSTSYQELFIITSETFKSFS